MSKMDGLRAMREAKYERRTAPASKPAATRRAAPPPPTPAAESPGATPEAEPEPEAGDELLCGHRAISGRTCTREQGHAEKSHRYS